MVLVPFPFSVKRKGKTMSMITTNEGRTVLKKADSMMVVPYVYNGSIGDYVVGNDVYDISAVIGDSITLEQSDGNTEAKYNEFKSSPLIENITDSKYAFTAQCLDLQDKVLKSLFGAMTTSNGSVAFNVGFVTLYALIRIRFSDSSLPDVVMPKVQLNSKLLIQQLKTRASQGNIAGTALPQNIAIWGNSSSNTVESFVMPSNNGTTYTPYTPVAFVPRSSLPFVRYYNGSVNYCLVNFATGAVNNSIAINEENGTWSVG